MSEESLVPKSYLSFDGIDDFVALPAMNIDWSQGLTVEAWVRYEKFNVFSRIIDFGNGAGQANIVFATPSATSGPFAQVFASQGNPYLQIAPPIEAGVFMHLAVTADPSGVGKLYKDGKLAQTGPLKIPDSINRTFNYIAKSQWDSDGYFHGQLAEVRVWKTPRSEAEIQRAMNQRLSGKEPGLVVYLPLDDGTGTTAHDLSPSGLHGTVNGANWVKAPVEQTSRPAVSAVDGFEELRKRFAEIDSKLAQLLEQQAAEESAHARLEQKLDEQLTRSTAMQEMLSVLFQKLSAGASALPVVEPSPAVAATEAPPSGEGQDAAASKRKRGNILWR